jgi:hypothetical protein
MKKLFKVTIVAAAASSGAIVTGGAKDFINDHPLK